MTDSEQDPYALKKRGPGRPKGSAPTRVSDAQWNEFLSHLSNCANIRFAAEAAGFKPLVAYQRRARNPRYAEQMEEAFVQARDYLHKAAWDRAVDGVQRTYTDKRGEHMTTTIFSDKLMIELLRAHIPEKFNRNSKVEVQVDSKVQVVLREDERALLAPIKRRLLLGGDPNFIDAEVIEKEPVPIEVEPREE